MRAALKRNPPDVVSARALERKVLHELDDGRLVLEHLAGDPQAFGTLVDRYQTRLLNFINRTIGDRERAEDLVQEVFIRVFRHLHRFDQTKKFSTWIYTIASNLGKNELRNRSRNPLVLFQTIKKHWEADHRPLQFEDTTARPDDLYRKRYLKQAVDQCVGQLPSHHRAVFVLRELEGKSYAEIADITGCNLGYGEEPPQSSPQQLRPAHRTAAGVAPGAGGGTRPGPDGSTFPSMTCAEFLDRYTDFRDGLITAPRELRRFGRHLVQCASCRRYDTAVRRGVLALQAGAESIEPSPEFRPRLDARLAHERRAAREVPARAGIAAALFIAAALALVAREGVRHAPVAHVPALPPVRFPKPVVQAGVPFVSFQDPRATVFTGNPNPYGTALVEPASAGR